MANRQALINADRWKANLVDNVLVGEIKMEKERRSPSFFKIISGFHTHVVRRRCTHTPCRTHNFQTHFPCVAYRHRVRAWLKVFAVRMSHLSMSPSPIPCSSTVFAVSAQSPRHFVLVCTFLAELSPIRKRGSSALPHNRRGVWLPGRSDALHKSWARRDRQDYLCRWRHDAYQRSELRQHLWLHKTTRENTGVFSASTTLEASVPNVSFGESKDNRETVAVKNQNRVVLWSVLQSRYPRKSDGTVSESHSLQTYRGFHSDERDLREDLDRRARQAVLGVISAQRKLIWLSTT